MRSTKKSKRLLARIEKDSYSNWVLEAPKAYVNLYMTRPARRYTKYICKEIIKGYEPEQALFPLVHKPHVYFH